MMKVLWVAGITYAVFVLHLAIAELTKLSGSRFGAVIMVLCVLDSASIGFTVWKAMQKAEATRRDLNGSRETTLTSPG